MVPDSWTVSTRVSPDQTSNDAVGASGFDSSTAIPPSAHSSPSVTSGADSQSVSTAAVSN